MSENLSPIRKMYNEYLRKYGFNSPTDSIPTISRFTPYPDDYGTPGYGKGDGCLCSACEACGDPPVCCGDPIPEVINLQQASSVPMYFSKNDTRSLKEKMFDPKMEDPLEAFNRYMALQSTKDCLLNDAIDIINSGSIPYLNYVVLCSDAAGINIVPIFTNQIFNFNFFDGKYSSIVIVRNGEYQIYKKN